MATRKRKVIRATTSGRRTKDPSELHLSDLDEQHYGKEPDFREKEILPEQRNSQVGRALNWYTHIMDHKMAKDFTAQLLISWDRKDEAKLLMKCPDSIVCTTSGSLSRLALYRGWVMSDSEKNFIETRVVAKMKEWHAENDKKSKSEDEDDVKKPARKSIQEIMIEKMYEAGGYIDGLIDEYIHTADAKGNVDPTADVLKILNEYNILAQHTNTLSGIYENEKGEFKEVLTGKDEQLVEAYSNFNKTQIKNIVNFYEKVQSAINSYGVLKLQSRAKRKRKPVSVEKLVSKLKHQRKFIDEPNKLELEGLHPKDLHDKKEAWVYDSAKRKLHHYVADSLGGTLFVKGNTLCGFDLAASQIKTLRKPAEQIPQIMGSKPAARQFFDKIKAVGVQPKGRFNDSMIILRAF